MPTTDEALKKERQEVQELRDQIAAAEAEKAKLAREKENDITAMQLDREKEALKAQLAQVHAEVDALGGDSSKIKVDKKVTRSAPNPTGDSASTSKSGNGEG